MNGVRGPVLFAANHQSHADTFVLLNALPHRFRTGLAITYADLGASTLSQLRSFLCTQILGMSVISGSPDILRQSLQCLRNAKDRGSSILIYPEGERSHSNEILPFLDGVGWLAQELCLPVVPVYIEDTHLVKRRLIASPVRLRIGRPLDRGCADFRSFTRIVEAAVHALASNDTGDL